MTADASAVLRALGLPGDRPLERPELERLVERAWPRRPELWRPHLDLSATAAHLRLRCTATRSVDVWAIFWLPENDTGWHDHDTSSGAVHVVAGALEEHALLRRRARAAHPLRRAARRSRSGRRTSTA